MARYLANQEDEAEAEEEDDAEEEAEAVEMEAAAEEEAAAAEEEHADAEEEAAAVNGAVRTVPKAAAKAKATAKSKAKAKVKAGGAAEKTKKDPKCWGCGETGHTKANCPNKTQEGGALTCDDDEDGWMFMLEWCGTCRQAPEDVIKDVEC